MANEDRREKIVETALEIFTERGCRGVTMDDIAQALRISKRTLYETFANKEELLAECMMMLHKHLCEVHRKAHERVDEPMLVAMYMLHEGAMVNRRYQRLLGELLRYYPDIHKRFFASHNEQLKEILQKGFAYMEAHNYLREKCNMEIATDFMCRYIQSNCTNESQKEYAMNMNEVCFTYLRGMMNVEAIKRYEGQEEYFQHLIEDIGLTE